ncbi:hypothetical protein RB196_24160 [Streptomyces sp. PmtA]|uniref:hypothetical protein n=1 Tax=Streptomyces sp. PmtA TaxID=3074275 RepID=UPI003014B6B9
MRSLGSTTYTALEGHTALSPKWQVVKGANHYDTATGRVTKVDDFGVDGDATDNQCTLTYYADNTTNHMLAFPVQGAHHGDDLCGHRQPRQGDAFR